MKTKRTQGELAELVEKCIGGPARNLTVKLSDRVKERGKQDMPTWQSAEEIQGWMTPEELAWLREHAAQCQSVVEIGSWKGRSTWALCESCPGVVHAVDWWGGADDGNVGAYEELRHINVHSMFMANVGHFPNLVVHRMKSRDFAKHPDAPDQVDMVFIDGDHSYAGCMGDLVDWWPRCTRFLCGHDASWEGVRQALDEFAPGQWRVVVGDIWLMWGSWLNKEQI